jgi:YHS domain-containing protein
MVVDENLTKFKSVHKGEMYYFCMMTCKKAFDSDPDRFAIESRNM